MDFQENKLSMLLIGIQQSRLTDGKVIRLM